MKKKNKRIPVALQVGDIVQSQRGAKWFGVVLAVSRDATDEKKYVDSEGCWHSAYDLQEEFGGRFRLNLGDCILVQRTHTKSGRPGRYHPFVAHRSGFRPVRRVPEPMTVEYLDEEES